MNADLLSADSWLTLWRPIWAVVLLLVGLVYIRKLKLTFNHEITRGKSFLFLMALALVYIVVGSPFHIIAADDLFSAYLLQLSILYLVLPPLLIQGAPTAWLHTLLRVHFLKGVLQKLTYPWVTAILFNVGLSIYLLPPVFHPIQAHAAYETLSLVLLFIMSVVMWVSILSPVRELHPLSEMQRIFYIFVTAVMLMPIAVWLLFANHVLYPAYAQTPQVISGLTATYDQQIGAGILKIFQLTAYGIVLAAIIYKWMQKEKEQRSSAKVIPFPVKDHSK